MVLCTQRWRGPGNPGANGSSLECMQRSTLGKLYDGNIWVDRRVGVMGVLRGKIDKRCSGAGDGGKMVGVTHHLSDVFGDCLEAGRFCSKAR